ncbi:hypothetical protein [uncultured Polaribacter sp.]|uniref:hypothetical protein n=1 Tax=uncultured Polaribacter sp. TaxID=174711 RepID=UPI00259B7F97|nr:hypothetical protein [uncultured Polaribacter sp.]
MSNQDLLNVANTIRSQIHPTVLMCAAARNYGAYEDEKGLYGLQFTISNTSAVKYGTVRITLNGSDLYNITIKNKNGKLLNTKSDIYCDQLNDVLESMWEKKELLKKYNPQIPTIQFTNVVPKLNNGGA